MSWTKGVTTPWGEIPFDTDNEEFARGFEAGAIFFQMTVRPTAFTAAVHDENRIMVQRMADRLQRDITFRDLPEELQARNPGARLLDVAAPSGRPRGGGEEVIEGEAVEAPVPTAGGVPIIPQDS